jgi:DNA invertase Pin-like site-specific DNA recombinase
MSVRYIYSRVSTDKQNVQQQSKYLADKYEHDAIVDEVFTGTTTERPKFLELLNTLKAGDTLIVYHVSRLGRKTSEVLEVVEHLQKLEVSVIVDQLQGIDVTSGVGKLLFTMLSGINRAKAEGKYKGRKAIDDDIIESAKLLLDAGKTKKDVAKQLGIGEATLYRRLAN